MARGLLLFMLSVQLTICVCHTSPLSTGWKGKKAEIYFLFDSSYSVWIVDYEKMLRFVADLVEDMDIKADATRVGIGLFSEHHEQYLALDNDLKKEDLKLKILDAPCPRGNTYISRALQGMLREGLSPATTRDGVPRMTVLITDGISRHKQLTQDNATLAKKEGIYLFTVGVGRDVDPSELLSIASDPKADFNYHVDSYDKLAGIRSKLLTEMSQVEFLQGDKSACGGNSRVDTVFVYDETALGERDSAYVKDFIKYLTSNIEMDSGNMRVGVVSRTCNTGDISLGQYLKRADFQDGLEYQPRQQGIVELMRQARLVSFQSEHGGRLDAGRRIVLVMDASIKDRELLVQGVRARYSENIDVFVIAIGKDSNNKNFINNMAKSDSHFWIIDSVDDLGTIDQRVKFRHKFCGEL